jgi:hypothetical protein
VPHNWTREEKNTTNNDNFELGCQVQRLLRHSHIKLSTLCVYSTIHQFAVIDSFPINSPSGHSVSKIFGWFPVWLTLVVDTFPSQAQAQ